MGLSVSIQCQVSYTLLLSLSRKIRFLGPTLSVVGVGVSRGYTDYHQGRAIHMADSRID